MQNMIVCGTFDENGGKPSGYMRRLFGSEDACKSVYTSVNNGVRLKYV